MYSQSFVSVVVKIGAVNPRNVRGNASFNQKARFDLDFIEKVPKKQLKFLIFTPYSVKLFIFLEVDIIFNS